MFVNSEALKLQQMQAFEETIFSVKEHQDFEHAKFTHTPIRQVPKIQQNNINSYEIERCLLIARRSNFNMCKLSRIQFSGLSNVKTLNMRSSPTPQ